MKKLLFLIAAMGLLTVAISCSDEDEPRKGGSVFTTNTPMINHMFNTVTGEVMGIANTHNRLTLDTAKHTASLELNYNDGSDKVLTLSDLRATPKRGGFYELSSSSNPAFSGYVDLNEETSMRYTYVTDNGIRVISTTDKVFFLKTENTITYTDTTPATSMENVNYQFRVNPKTGTAIVKVVDIEHAMDMRHFFHITAFSVPFTVTANGYTFAGQNLSTTAEYYAFMDSTGHADKSKTTDQYPFKTFNATVDLVNDHMEATFKMGANATVVASGRTYPDYTAY